MFCLGQGIDLLEEFDGLDDRCLQYLVKREDLSIATARLRTINKKLLRIERVAVIGQERRKGIGQRFVMWIIENANIGKNQLLGSHAQYHAKKFYEGLGFVQIGDSFEEVGIRHIYMEFFFTAK